MKGPACPLWRHGNETQAAKATRSAKLAELRDLEAAMVTLGVMQGKRWPGRKPKAV